MSNPFDFLESLVKLEEQISELEQLSTSSGVTVAPEVTSLRAKLAVESRALFATLTPWQRVQLSRHPLRPQASDYVDHMVEDFVPLSGDRRFADDEAIITGIGRLGDHAVMIVGQQKGKDVHERRRCNFGMPHPEGYRKAMAKMRIAEKFGLPIICLINTPGAFPGVEAEERGQSIAIAENIRDMALIRVPILVVVIGEGGSGGALGIGVGDRIIMLQNSYFSVISPEGCAAILWKDGAKRELAAERLKLTGTELMKFGIVDEIVEEPAGGAHRQPLAMIEGLKTCLLKQLAQLQTLTTDELLERRYQKYRAIGEVRNSAAAAG
jgi:acetyl-CoA carboxylase carboxyl transferase subunit alpha